MATRTFTNGGVNNLWSTAGNWDTPPVDDDTVVIAAGQTCEYDADWSSAVTYPNGLNGLTITGTLKISTVTSSYMKMKAATLIVGAGTFNIGTSGAGAIPFAVKFTLTGGAGWYIDGVAGLTMTVFGAEPAIKYVLLSGAEAIGQTELSVAADVRGDIWAVGDTIRIDDINQAAESEERVIAAAGIAETTITVTAGLTAAKSIGAVVSLITRNVKIIAVGTGSRTIYRVTGAGKLTIGGGMFYGVNRTMIDACTYTTISGGTFSVASNVINASSFTSISGGVFSGNVVGLASSPNVTVSGGVFSGNSGYIFNACNSLFVSGGTYSGNALIFYTCIGTYVSGGTFSGTGTVFYLCTSPFITGGTFTLNTNVVHTCINIGVSGGTFTSNTYDLRASDGRLHNITLTSSPENFQYTTIYPDYQNCQSEDHDGNDGALMAWCKGGVVSSQTAVKPTGYTQAYLHDVESATLPCFWYKQFSVEPGKTVSVEVQLRKDASMSYLPKVYLVKSIENPLAGSTPTDMFEMTNSVDTWETDTFTVTNTTNYDQDYTLWFVAKNASGNAYSAYEITVEGGGGGAVSIQPIQGTVRL